MATTTINGAGFITAATQSAKRTIFHFFRTPQLIILGTVQGALFLFMFRYIFGGAISPGENIAYVDFLVPGFIVTQILFLGMSAATGVAADASTGVHDRMRFLPIARVSVLFGRSLADAALTLWGILVVSSLAFIVGFRPDAAASELGLALLLVLAATYSFMWVFIAIGLSAKNPQAANATATLMVVPLAFVSAAFVPTGSLPGWLQAVADNQPLTIFSNALRSLTLGGPETLRLSHGTGYWVAMSLLWCAGIMLVFGTIAVLRFTRDK